MSVRLCTSTACEKSQTDSRGVDVLCGAGTACCLLPCQCTSVSTHSQCGEPQFVSHILLSLNSGLGWAGQSGFPLVLAGDWVGKTCKISKVTHWCRQIKFCLGRLHSLMNLLLTNLPHFQLHWKMQWNQALIKEMRHYGAHFQVWNENLFFKEEN